MSEKIGNRSSQQANVNNSEWVKEELEINNFALELNEAKQKFLAERQKEIQEQRKKKQAPNSVSKPEQEKKYESVAEKREKLKKDKKIGAVIKKRILPLALAGAIFLTGAIVGDKVEAENSAFADTKIEQIADDHELKENEYGIAYNYDGLFGGEDGSGYNENKEGKYQFASGEILGETWGDEYATREALTELVERQPDLNGADYLCQLNNDDLDRIEMTENGTDLSVISKWMDSDKDFNQEATTLLGDIFKDENTKISFGRLTEFSSAGTYYNAYGKIKNINAENDTSNVDIVACQTSEDQNTAVVVVDTENGSRIMIKAGHYDSDGNYIKDGCTQAINQKADIYKNLERVDDNGGGSGDGPTPSPSPEPSPTPDPKPTPEKIQPKDSANEERIAHIGDDVPVSNGGNAGKITKDSNINPNNDSNGGVTQDKIKTNTNQAPATSTKEAEDYVNEMLKKGK